MQTSLCRFKLRRGKEADRIKITPEEGEPIFSTDVGRLAVGNGNTPGGVPVNKVWTDSVSAETYAVIGDIKYENNKQYIYKGNNEWVQFGGDGLVAANAPLSVITNNTVVLNLSSYEGNNNKIDLAVNNGKLIVNAGTLVDEVLANQDDIININSNISELSANRIYNSISPVVLGYSAVYTDNSGEVPSSKLPPSVTSFSGTCDGKPYKIDRGVKLLYNNETFTTTLKNVTFYEYNNTGSLVQVTSSLPHLDVNLANIEQKATTAATNAAISNVDGTVDSKINTAVIPITANIKFLSSVIDNTTEDTVLYTWSTPPTNDGNCNFYLSKVTKDRDRISDHYIYEHFAFLNDWTNSIENAFNFPILKSRDNNFIYAPINIVYSSATPSSAGDGVFRQINRVGAIVSTDTVSGYNIITGDKYRYFGNNSSTIPTLVYTMGYAYLAINPDKNNQ